MTRGDLHLLLIPVWILVANTAPNSIMAFAAVGMCIVHCVSLYNHGKDE